MKFCLVEVTDGGASFDEFKRKDVEVWAKHIHWDGDDRAQRLREFVQNARVGDVFVFGNGTVFAINDTAKVTG